MMYWIVLAFAIVPGISVIAAAAAALFAPRARASDAVIGFALMVYSLLAMPFAPLVAIFQGRSISSEGRVHPEVPRYALPRWLSWFQTPDEPMPGGLYEDAVYAAYAKGGRWWCATVWLARNSLFGLGRLFAWPASGYIDAAEGLVEGADGLWRWQGTWGPLKMQTGRKVYRADFVADYLTGPLVSVPFFTVRRAHQD